MADSVYWTEFDAIRCAPLAGGGTVETLYDYTDGVSSPQGLAIDPAAGRIYWSNSGDDTIRWASLAGAAGGGTADTLYDNAQGVSDPVGLAIDSVAGRIYWTNSEWVNNVGVVGTIRRAPLAYSGSVPPVADTLYGGPGQGLAYPSGLAIDRAAGRIYWSDTTAIYGAPLAGAAGGGTFQSLYGSLAAPNGVAIDSAAGRIYWGEGNYQYAGRIQGAPLAAGRGVPVKRRVDTLYDSTRGVSIPWGVAIDPDPGGPVERLEVGDTERFTIGSWLGDVARSALGNLFSRPSGSPGRIYWANTVSAVPGQPPGPNDRRIQDAPLAGRGTVDTLYDSAHVASSPGFLALLRAPLGTAPPTISHSFILDDGSLGGGGQTGPPGQRLSCSTGTWAPDLLGSHLYRAPQSFAYQWRKNGADISGATAPHYDPSDPGSYSCRVTVTNQAGSAAQTSAAVTAPV